MLKAFRHNTLLQLLVILLITVILWMKAFVVPVEMRPIHYFSPIYTLLQSFLIHLPRLASAIALLLILVEGIWLNIILSNNKLTKINWLMPTLLFILAISWSNESATLSPMILASLPLLAAVTQLLASGNTNLEVDRNFNAAFLLGIATLCYFPVAAYIVPFFLVIVTYKSYHWRDIIVAILGITAPIFLMLIYSFLTDKLEYYYILFIHDIVDVHFNFDTSNLVGVVTNIIFIMILLWALFSQFSTINDTTIQQRINTIIFTLPLVAILLMLPYDNIFTINTQFAAIPFAFISNNLLATERKRLWINELLFWIILLTPLASNILIS